MDSRPTDMYLGKTNWGDAAQCGVTEDIFLSRQAYVLALYMCAPNNVRKYAPHMSLHCLTALFTATVIKMWARATQMGQPFPAVIKYRFHRERLM
jgi:hypothetical protein